MTDIEVRHVGVEFLRPGPAHNQLLSPLTQYLAVCGDSSAGVVTVPFEHARFAQRLRELRYETGDPQDRGGLLHETGADMGRILGAVPGLPGALTFDRRPSSTLVHLRITLSASELALLPFELAKLPVSSEASGETWLSLQTRPPVCITRSIRTVSPEEVEWPHAPRILFVSGDPKTVPCIDHFQALLAATEDFRYPPSDGPERRVLDQKDRKPQGFGELLTVLVNPTLSELLAECHRVSYTHVHFLMHGDYDDPEQDSYGLVFRGVDDASDVVSGERLASAITAIGHDGVHRPTIVTLASCDSGNVGSVVVPGASVAHALHEAGVPLVVASQFPLSIEASKPLAERLYTGLLHGDHPLVLLQQLRAELHARYSTSWHDWASLVVYEALPIAIEEQLDTFRYKQARQAINTSLEKLDRALAPQDGRQDKPAERQEDVERAIGLVPRKGQWVVECLGLRAAARKRQAQMAFKCQAAGVRSPLRKGSRALLEEALREYERAYETYLGSHPDIVRRGTTLHWVLTQYLSLCAVLRREPPVGTWEAARLATENCLHNPSEDEQAWAHATLAELWMLRRAHPRLSSGEYDEAHQNAVAEARALADMHPGVDPFTLSSTLRQFQRYLDWWGDDRFASELDAGSTDAPGAWRIDTALMQTATAIADLLQRKEGEPRGRAPAPPSPSPSSTPAEKAGENATAPSSKAGPVGGAAVLGGSRRREDVAPSERVHTGPFFDIEMLPAEHGDCLWIEYGDDKLVHRWLLDCGTHNTGTELLRRVDALPKRDRLLELFVMSHIDADHIGGALPFLKAFRRDLQVVDLWFNGWRHISGVMGARQGEMFSTAIEDLEIPWNVFRDGGPIAVGDDERLPEHRLPGGMTLTLLSPAPAQLRRLAPAWRRELKKNGLVPGARVDYSKFLKRTISTSTDVEELAAEPFVSDSAPANGSSIAVLAEYAGAAALLAADAHPAVLVGSLRRLLEQRGVQALAVDAFKVSHHASQNNLSPELLDLVDARRYLVSTNGNHFFHPDREAIARIVRHGRSAARRPGGAAAQLCFNYRTEYNELWASDSLQERYGYLAHYPEAGREGMIVSLLPSAAVAPVG